jgi:hypothetical protein
MIHQNDKRKWICTAAGEFLRKNGTKNRFPHWKSIKQLNGAKGTALTAKKQQKKSCPHRGSNRRPSVHREFWQRFKYNSI